MATRDTTGSMGPTLGTGTGASTSNMSGQAEELRRDAADQGGRLVDKARSSVRSAFEHQQNRTADSIGSVAQALHRAADELNQQNQGVVARYTDTAADRIERFADSLRHRDVDDLVADVEGFARRQPELFIGGAVALGFLFSRFLRASGDRYQRRQSTTGYSGYQTGSPGYGRSSYADRFHGVDSERPHTGDRATYPVTSDTGMGSSYTGARGTTGTGAPNTTGSGVTGGTGTGLGSGSGSGTGLGGRSGTGTGLGTGTASGTGTATGSGLGATSGTQTTGTSWAAGGSSSSPSVGPTTYPASGAGSNTAKSTTGTSAGAGASGAVSLDQSIQKPGQKPGEKNEGSPSSGGAGA
jgi:hypothetical protein